MDDLPTIKPLTRTQQMIREALKTIPPLKISKPSVDDKEFVVFGDQNNDNKPKTNSLFDRFLNHKNMSAKNCSATEAADNGKGVGHKWSHLKDKLTEEMERKRLESLKLKEINHKLENEEVLDVEDELDINEDNELVSDCDPNEDDLEAEVNLNEGEQEDEGVDGDNEEEEDIDEEEEEEDIDEEEEDDNGSDEEPNPFIDDEAEDDDEVDERYAMESNENSCELKGNGSQEKSELMADEECNDNNDLNESLLNSSLNSMDESFDRKCATQKIALSPFMTQKAKPRLEDNLGFRQLIGRFDANVEESGSQDLLGLCSGNFSQTVSQSEDMTEERTEANDSEERKTETEDMEDDEQKEGLSQAKRTGKVFNIESDCESDAEECVKSTDNKISAKSFNESDGEELLATEDEVSDEEEEEQEVGEEAIAKMGKSYFDDEAELSGSDDVSSDEDDGDDDYDRDLVADAEELPSDSELKDQIGRIHNKNLLDEDKRQLMIMKEMLFEDGDLHDDGLSRQKKFRWKFEGNDTFVNDYINEDSDDHYMDSDDDQNTATPALKMLDRTADDSPATDQSLEKLKKTFKLNFDSKAFNKKTTLDSNKVNSLSAFVVRDERLKSILSKRTIATKDSLKANKKFKSSKKNGSKASIFDLLNQY